MPVHRSIGSTSLACALVMLAATAVAGPASAQTSFYYPAPSATSYRVMRDVKVGVVDTMTLRMDVYRPTNTTTPRPALIVFFAGSGRDSGNTFTKGWARVAASKGLVAILPDLRFGSQERDFDALLEHLMSHGRSYGIDTAAIAVYAGSGNAFTALPILENPARKAVKAGVIFYGTAPVTTFRRDLPLLIVRAGLDRPSVPAGIADMVNTALKQNVPLTLINDAGGHHAFEIVDDDAVTRDVVDATVDFVRRVTARSYQAVIRRTMNEATAAAHIATGNFADAATIYASLYEARRDDPQLGLSYAEALLGAQRYEQACAVFGPLKGKGLGPRDLGLPAARACMLSGNSAGAIEWLQTIPKRFLPPTVANEAVFAPLKGSDAFDSLFRP